MGKFCLLLNLSSVFSAKPYVIKEIGYYSCKFPDPDPNGIRMSMENLKTRRASAVRRIKDMILPTFCHGHTSDTRANYSLMSCSMIQMVHNQLVKKSGNL